MLSLICAIFGLILIVNKRVKLSAFRAAGDLVRRAGIVLIVPIIVGFVTGLITLIMNMDQIGATIATMTEANVDMQMQAILDMFWLASVLEFMAILVALPTAIALIWSARGNNPQPEPVKPKRYAVDLPVASQTSRRSGSVPAPAPVAEYPLVLTVEEAAQMLGVSGRDVMWLIDDGKLPAARLGSGFRIARAAVEDYMAGEI